MSDGMQDPLDLIEGEADRAKVREYVDRCPLTEEQAVRYYLMHDGLRAVEHAAKWAHAGWSERHIDMQLRNRRPKP